jgi:hypothetical protein
LVGRKPRRAKDIAKSVECIAPGLSRAVDLICSTIMLYQRWIRANPATMVRIESLLKPGAGGSVKKDNPRRAEVFALPILGPFRRRPSDNQV